MHEMSLADIRVLCVDGFPTSTTRRDIMERLEQMFDSLRQHNVRCSVWLDGSFLTRKIDPGDVDLVVCIPSDFADNCDMEQQALLEELSRNLKRSGKCARCDTFLCIDPRLGDPLFGELAAHMDDWRRFFGHSRKGIPKGLATVQVGDVI